MLRPPDAAGATVLRLLDVAIWITHSPAREAQRARLAARPRGLTRRLTRRPTGRPAPPGRDGQPPP